MFTMVQLMSPLKPSQKRKNTHQCCAQRFFSTQRHPLDWEGEGGKVKSCRHLHIALSGNEAKVKHKFSFSSKNFNWKDTSAPRLMLVWQLTEQAHMQCNPPHTLAAASRRFQNLRRLRKGFPGNLYRWDFYILESTWGELGSNFENHIQSTAQPSSFFCPHNQTIKHGFTTAFNPPTRIFWYFALIGWCLWAHLEKKCF